MVSTILRPAKNDPHFKFDQICDVIDQSIHNLNRLMKPVQNYYRFRAGRYIVLIIKCILMILVLYQYYTLVY